jgi:hypothetical protein
LERNWRDSGVGAVLFLVVAGVIYGSALGAMLFARMRVRAALAFAIAGSGNDGSHPDSAIWDGHCP